MLLCRSSQSINHYCYCCICAAIPRSSSTDMLPPCLQSGAEQIMRNVAKRMLYGEVAQALIRWQLKFKEHQSAERGKAIMRRVGGRWRNREASDAIKEWCGKQLNAKQHDRGEAIMRRVGGRWKNQEVATNFGEWVRNYKRNLTTANSVLKLRIFLTAQVNDVNSPCTSHQ